jgi:hypothetical protein
MDADLQRSSPVEAEIDIVGTDAWAEGRLQGVISLKFGALIREGAVGLSLHVISIAIKSMTCNANFKLYADRIGSCRLFAGCTPVNTYFVGSQN